MKNRTLLIVSSVAVAGIITAVACSDTPMDMPKNDSGTGMDQQNPSADNYVPTDGGFMPDAGNSCDKGIKFDNMGRVPGYPNNIPMP